MKPRIALTLGDPSGIGPELVAKLLNMSEIRDLAHLLVIGDEWLFDEGCAVAGVDIKLPRVTNFNKVDLEAVSPVFLAIQTIEREDVTVGEESAAGGGSGLAALQIAVDLTLAGEIDAVMYAPMNKHAMHLSGYGFSDESRWLAHRLNYDGPVSEFNVLDKLWTSRVTSHVPLKDVSTLITSEKIVTEIRVTHDALVQAGVTKPRLGIAALNPHAGEGGVFGREEIDVIEPAVEEARALGLNVAGPFPADSIFPRAFKGVYDAVVTMYHDQGQIAMKLMGLGRGVTVLGTLPIPVTTPAHGTAYDIVGQDKAEPEAIRQAFHIACRMGANRRTELRQR